MSEAAAAESLARLELEKLSTKIAAAQGLLASMEMTDNERERFLAYIGRMQHRQGELRQALSFSAEDADVTEARVSSVEQTLRHMDDRLSRIVDQIHGLDSRQGRLEDRIERIETEGKAHVDQLRQLQDQLRTLASPPGYSRTYLAIGAMVMAVMLLLLLVITWRLL